MALVPESHFLAIQMLGSFRVRLGGKTLSDDSVRSRKMWKLFKYLVANHDHRIPAEVLYEVLWQHETCANPAKALQNLVYRLRNILVQAAGDRNAAERIIYAQGCYGWNSNISYWLDVETFETNAKHAIRISKRDPETAIHLLEGVIDLYQGDFLPECQTDHWVIGMRSQLQRQYFDCVDMLLALYAQNNAFARIVSLCEDALRHNPNDEALHARLIHALIDQGKVPQAQAHYESISAQLYRVLGVKPSRELKEVYRRIRDASGDQRPTLSTIQCELSEKIINASAFYCDTDTFHTLCMVESRRILRSGRSVLLLLLTLSTPEHLVPDTVTVQTAMTTLINVLISNLRMGDVLTRWGETQCLVMLHSLPLEDGDRVADRLKSAFYRAHLGSPVVLHSSIEPLDPAWRTKGLFAQ